MEKALIIKIVLGLIIGGGLGAIMGYFGKCSSGSCPLTANPFRGSLYGMVLGGLLSLSLAPAATCPTGVTPGAPVATDDTHAKLAHAQTMSDFENMVLQGNGPVLVDFYSDTCPPCIRLAPILAEVANDYSGKATVVKVNVRDLPEAFQQYRVNATPTVVFFQNGQEVERIRGLGSKDNYTSILDQLL
jgi:thioredoxin 1